MRVGCFRPSVLRGAAAGAAAQAPTSGRAARSCAPFPSDTGLRPTPCDRTRACVEPRVRPPHPHPTTRKWGRCFPDRTECWWEPSPWRASNRTGRQRDPSCTPIATVPLGCPNSPARARVSPTAVVPPAIRRAPIHDRHLYHFRYFQQGCRIAKESVFSSCGRTQKPGTLSACIPSVHPAGVQHACTCRSLSPHRRFFRQRHRLAGHDASAAHPDHRQAHRQAAAPFGRGGRTGQHRCDWTARRMGPIRCVQGCSLPLLRRDAHQGTDHRRTPRRRHGSSLGAPQAQPPRAGAHRPHQPTGPYPHP